MDNSTERNGKMEVNVKRGTPKEVATFMASMQGQQNSSSDKEPTLRIETTGRATHLWLNGLKVKCVLSVSFSHKGGEDPILEITYNNSD